MQTADNSAKREPTMAMVGSGANQSDTVDKSDNSLAQKGRTRRIVLACVVIVGASVGLGYYLWERHFEETDDAEVDGDISNVSSRVSGTIQSVYVRENEPVKVGALLAEIDPSDLDVAVEEARAQVAQAEAQLKAEDPNVAITETSNTAAVASASQDISSSVAGVSAAEKDVEQLAAQLAQAQASDRQAQLDQSRAEKLLKTNAISQAEFDQRTNAAAGTEASVAALKQALAAAKDRIAEAQARAATAHSRLFEVKSNAPMQVEAKRATVLVRQAALDLARAQLHQAELNLSYAKIVSPVTGIIGKKTVAVGDHVAPGQELLAIAATENLWVTANFRETQLKRLRPGQHATIHVDSLDVDLSGTIDNIGGATGARFSVLPPENASGNYVKVVQRVPVRIRFDPGQGGMDKMRPGMSVEPRVRVE